MASNLSISKAWDQTRDIFRRDGGLIVSVALALIVLPEVVVGLIAPPDAGASGPSMGIQLLRLIVGMIALIGQLSIIRLALGPSTTVGDAIQHGVRRFPAALGAVVILLVALAIVAIPVLIVLSLILGVDIASMRGQPSGPAALLVLIFVLAVLAISVRFTLASPVASAETAGPLAIIKRSWELTRGNYWRLLGLVVLLLIAALALLVSAGVIGGLLARLVSSTIEPFSVSALIVALIAGVAQGVFSVLASLMLARVYAQVSGRDAEASVPSSGT